MALLVLLSAICSVLSQPTYEYDGVSTVELTTSYNFTLKYPLGYIRNTFIWEKKLTVNVIAETSEADLVFAIGTDTQYLAATIAYDGGISLPLNNGESRRNGAVFVTPPSGEPLQHASPTLEQQYAQDIDFRDALIPTGTLETDEWERLIEKGSPMGSNTSPLILYVSGDRENDITYLMIEKNGLNVSIELDSTWGYHDDDDIFLFMTVDSVPENRVNEVFEVTGITVEDIDDCCCGDSIADLEAEIEAINQRIFDFGNSAADAPPIPPSMSFTDGDDNVWTEYIDLNGKDLFIILLLLVNFIGMICNRYSMHSKERRSVNGKKYAVQYDQDTDMEPINE